MFGSREANEAPIDETRPSDEYPDLGVGLARLLIDEARPRIQSADFAVAPDEIGRLAEPAESQEAYQVHDREAFAGRREEVDAIAEASGVAAGGFTEEIEGRGKEERHEGDQQALLTGPPLPQTPPAPVDLEQQHSDTKITYSAELL
jgi:hypothetical protein